PRSWSCQVCDIAYPQLNTWHMCSVVGQLVKLRAGCVPALQAGCQPAAGFHPAPHSGKPQTKIGVPPRVYVVGCPNPQRRNQGETPCNSLSPNSRKRSTV